MKATFDQHIGVFENAVPKEWCEQVIKAYESSPQLILTRREHEGVDNYTYKEDSNISLIEANLELCKKFNSLFWENAYSAYQDKYKLKSVLTPNLTLDDFKVQKTLPSQGYHTWHIENDNIQFSHRVMVYTVYLNDVEEGGETEFLLQSKRLKPKQGTICIFPSSYTHIHRGNPPLSGIKYIMTGWISYLPEPEQPQK